VLRWCTAIPMQRCDRGQQLLLEVREVFLQRDHNLPEVPIVDVYAARQTVQRGDRNGAAPLIRAAADHHFRERLVEMWGVARSFHRRWPESLCGQGRAGSACE
jgi:hypothetical protein